MALFIGQDFPMRLSHVLYAAPHVQLAKTVQRLDARIGSTFVDSGVHPIFSARNFMLPLQNGQYIGVIYPIHNPPKEQTPRGKAVSKKVKEGGGWLNWVFTTEEISKVEVKFGHRAIEGNRTLPAGSILNGDKSE